MLTLADHLEAIRESVSPLLISSSNYKAIENFASQFPFNITRDHGFECRLGEKGAWSDYLFCVYRDSPGANILAGDQTIFLPGGQSWLQNCKTVRDFAKEWISPGTFFHNHINCIWFEFDYVNNCFSEVPKVFLGIDNFSTADEILRANFVSNLVSKVSRVFFRDELPQNLHENITNCISRLPEKSGFYHIGFYLEKKLNALRLVLTKLKGDALLGYLDKIQWPGDVNKIEEVMEDLNSRFDYSVIDLDIAEKILPNIGIELYYDRSRNCLYDPRWESNLRWLIEKKWCLPGKANGLLNFPGKHAGNPLLRLHYLNFLNHVKIVFKGAEKTNVKVYFGTYIREFAEK